MQAHPDSPPDTIRIGCAGWSIASAHAHLFGEGDSVLARYATRFDVVEINSSFYRPHQPKTYARWAATVPPHFRFSAKVPRTVTHDARLAGADDALARFIDEVTCLGDRLGGILVQLPPSLGFDAHIVDAFFDRLRRRFDGAVACEPRHAGWFTPAADAVWAGYRIARVAADPPRPRDALQVAGEGAWHYWRWHGSPKIYYSEYTDEQLRLLADDLIAHATPSRPAWCILDNTALGHATTDAVKLQAMCSVGRPVAGVG